MKIVLEQNKAIIVSILIAIIGCSLELFFGFTGWFAKSGPLIVCVGVYFGIRGVNKYFTDQIAHLEQNRSETDIVHSDKDIDSNIRGSTNSLIGKVQETSKDMIGVVEAWIIIAGTLIWGFGELICYF